MKALKSLDMPTIHLISAPHKVSINQDGDPEYSAGGWPLYRQKYVAKDGATYDVQYYEESHFDNNNREVFGPRRYNWPGNIDRFNLKNDAEKVFFLVFVSPHCMLKDELKDLQNDVPRDKRNLYYMIHDEKSDARNTLKTVQDSIMIQEKLWLEGTRLAVDDVKVIGRSVGLAGLEELSEEQVRLKVGNYFLKQKDGVYDAKRIKSFFEIMPASGGIDAAAKCMALVSQLKELKLIKTYKVGGRMEYQTAAGNTITSFALAADADSMLANFFKEHPEERDMFEQLIEDNLVSQEE